MRGGGVAAGLGVSRLGVRLRAGLQPLLQVRRTGVTGLFVAPLLTDRPLMAQLLVRALLGSRYGAVLRMRTGRVPRRVTRLRHLTAPGVRAPRLPVSGPTERALYAPVPAVPAVLPVRGVLLRPGPVRTRYGRTVRLPGPLVAALAVRALYIGALCLPGGVVRARRHPGLLGAALLVHTLCVSALRRPTEFVRARRVPGRVVRSRRRLDPLGAALLVAAPRVRALRMPAGVVRSRRHRGLPGAALLVRVVPQRVLAVRARRRNAVLRRAAVLLVCARDGTVLPRGGRAVSGARLLLHGVSVTHRALGGLLGTRVLVPALLVPRLLVRGLGAGLAARAGAADPLRRALRAPARNSPLPGSYASAWPLASGPNASPSTPAPVSAPYVSCPYASPEPYVSGPCAVSPWSPQGWPALVAQGAGAPPGRVAGGVPPHCSTRDDVVNSPDSSGSSPSATGMDHCPVTSWPGAAGAGSSKFQCWVAAGSYVKRSPPCVAPCPVSGSGHWPLPWPPFGSGHRAAPPSGAGQPPSAGAPGMLGGT